MVMLDPGPMTGEKRKHEHGTPSPSERDVSPKSPKRARLVEASPVHNGSGVCVDANESDEGCAVPSSRSNGGDVQAATATATTTTTTTTVPGDHDRPGKTRPSAEVESEDQRASVVQVQVEAEAEAEAEAVANADADADAHTESSRTRRPSEPVQSPSLSTTRRDFSQEEKKRGKRLFGGLLNTLSQTAGKTGKAQQKKRLDRERSLLERHHQQKADEDRRRVLALARLRHERELAQIKFDEQVMHTRHANMLAMAKSLRTKSEPRLCYRPWKLTASQRSVVREQTLAAETTVARETNEFQHRKQRRLKELGKCKHAPAVGEPDLSPTTNNRPPSPKSTKSNHDKDHDGDEMVQDKEDTVLY